MSVKSSIMISLKVIYYKYIWKCLTYVSDNFTHLPFSKDFLLPRRPPSKNNRNVLKISYIKGKYLGNRYLPLVFCAYSACSKCRIRGQNQGKCFPKIRSVFPKPFICFPKNTGCFPKKSRCFPDFRTLQTGILSQFE